jgi:hypothetical protein
MPCLAYHECDLDGPIESRGDHLPEGLVGRLARQLDDARVIAAVALEQDLPRERNKNNNNKIII